MFSVFQCPHCTVGSSNKSVFPFLHVERIFEVSQCHSCSKGDSVFDNFSFESSLCPPFPQNLIFVPDFSLKLDFSLVAPGFEAEIYRRLLLNESRHHYRVYKREDIPTHWHFAHNRRVMPIVAVANIGYQFVSSDYSELLFV